MAQVPYDPAPSVPAEEQQPNDQIRVDATPASFGGPIGQGLEAAAAGGLDASKFYNQVAADHATNNYLDARTKILYGDPTQPMLDAQGNPVMGPDGKPAPDTGLYGRQGADAMAYAPQARAALDEAHTDLISTLGSAAAREAFENQSRRFRAADNAQIGQHVDQQTKAWAANVADTKATLGLNQAATNPNDPLTTAMATSTVRDAYVKAAQLKYGNDPTVVQGAILKADQDVATKRIDALLQTDPVSAQKIYQDNASTLGSLPAYGAMGRQIKDAVVNVQTGPMLETAVNDAVADAQRMVAPGAATGAGNSYVTAVGGRETAGAADAATARNPQSSATGTDQFIKSTWLSVMKDPSFAAITAGKSPEQILALRNDPTISAQATLVYARQNTPALQSAGVPINAATLGLAHGFGPEGAVSLYKAPPETPAPQVLSAAAIAANPQLANQTAGQVVQGFTRRFGTGHVDATTGAISGGQYLSTADALNATIPQRVEQYREQLTKAFPQYPDVVERQSEIYERRLDQVVSQQTRATEVASHIVNSALFGTNGTDGPITQEQLLAQGPQVAQAYHTLLTNNPDAMRGVQARFDANARGQASAYGTEAHTYIDRVLAPRDDPTRIANAAQLNGFVGPGDDAPLTNTGVNGLAPLISLRSTPQGEAQAAQIKSFLDQMHGDITFSNAGTGIVDRSGERLYSKFVAGVMPDLLANAKAGTLAKVLDPKSPDYLGKAAAGVMRTPGEILKDRAEYDRVDTDNPEKSFHHPYLQGPAYTVQSLATTLNGLENDRQRAETIQDAISSKRLTPQVAAAYLASKRGGHAPPVTLPPLVQPPNGPSTLSDGQD